MPLILKNEPAVQFNEIAGIFVVSFGRPSFTAEAPVVDKDGGVPVKSSVKILQMLADKPDLTAHELSNVLQLTKRAVEKQICKLQKAGLLRRIGPDKGGHWEVVH